MCTFLHYSWQLNFYDSWNVVRKFFNELSFIISHVLPPFHRHSCPTHTACNFPHTHKTHTYFLANCDPLIHWGRDKTALGPFKEWRIIVREDSFHIFFFLFSASHFHWKKNAKNVSLITSQPPGRYLIINFRLKLLSRQNLKLNHFSICLHILRAMFYAGNTLRNVSTTKTKKILCVSHTHWELSTRKSFFIDPMISE